MDRLAREALSEPFGNTRIPPQRLNTLIDLATKVPYINFFMGPETPENILNALVLTLNDFASTWPEKEGALSIIAHMSANRDQRNTVLGGLDGLSQKFDEALLTPREAGEDYQYIRKSTVHLLIILERIQDYRLRAPELLEFLDGNVELALYTIKHVLGSHRDYELGILHGMCRLLLDFSLPDTYFDAEKEKFNPLNYLPFSIAAHSIFEFPRIIDYVCSFCLSADIVNILIDAVADTMNGIEDTQRFTEFIVMGNVFLTFLLHLHQQSSGTSGELRQYLNSSQKTVHNLLMPYLHLSLKKWMADRHRGIAENHGRAGFVACLKVLILCTFRVNPSHKYTMAIRAANPTASIISTAAGLLKADLPALSLLLCFNVNIDSMASAALTTTVQQDPVNMSIRELKATLMDRGVAYQDCVEKSDLVDRVRQTEAAADGMPTNCTGRALSAILEDMFYSDPSSAMTSEQLEGLRNHLTRGNHHNNLLITRDLTTYRVLWKMIGGDDGTGAPEGGGSSDPAKYYNPPAANEVEMQDLSRPPAEFFEKMMEMVNEAFEVVEVTDSEEEDEGENSVSADIESTTVEVKPPASARTLEPFGDPESAPRREEPPSKREEPSSRPDPVDVTPQKRFNPSSLSDLPSLSPNSQKEQARGKKKSRGDGEKKKKKVRVPVAGGQPKAAAMGNLSGFRPPGMADHTTPPEFCCAINKHLMKDPVRSPYGHVFERETIELWLNQQGSVCPVTNKPLSIGELRGDEQLKQNIIAYNIALVKRLNEDEEYDLYSF